MISDLKIVRLLDASKQAGISRSSIYLKIKLGLWPPSISLGARAIGFIQFEVDEVLKAMINGASTDELKALVQQLVSNRKKLEVSQ